MSEIMSNQNPFSLRLTHLFLITTVFGLVAGIRGYELGLYKLAAKSQGTDTAGLGFEQGIPIACSALIEGCAFAGGIFLVFNYLYCKRALRHPGHWFLTIAAIFHLFDRCLKMSLAYNFAYFGMPSNQYMQLYFWKSAFIQILVAAAWIAITVFVAKRFGKMWWLASGLFMTLNLEIAASPFFPQSVSCFGFTQFALLIAIIGSIAQDVRHALPRDWLHWLGVFLIVFELGFCIIGNLVLWLLA